MRGWLVLVALVCALGGWAASTASARTLHYLVSVTVTGPGRITGTGTGGSIDCPGNCSALIMQNTSMTLTARPDADATFGGWGEDCASYGTQSDCTITLSGQGGDGNKSISAGFNEAPPPPPMAKLTVTKAGTGSGFVGGAGGIDCGPTCSASFVQGTKLTLLAVPDDGSKFAGWRGGGCTGTDQCAVTLGADTEVTATFDHLDRDPPHIRTIGGVAKRGGTARLRFRVFDDSGKSRETLTIMNGKVPIGRVAVPLGPVEYRHIYTATWHVPARAAKGTRLYCAVASDEAGNASKRSCSALRIT